MTDQLPTSEEAFGTPPDKSNQLPTAEEAFGDSLQPKPMAGPVADHYFGQGSLKKLQDFFFNPDVHTQSFMPGVDEELKNLGVFNDYTKNENNHWKEINAALIRPPLFALDAASRTFQAAGSTFGAVVGGAAEYMQKASRDLQSNPYMAPISKLPAAAITGVPGELTGIFAEGGGMDVLGAPHNLESARANGVIGESSAKYFGTAEVSPEELLARARATGEQTTKTVRLDIHDVARQMDPEMFQEYDSLKAQEYNLRQTLANLKETGKDLPDFQEQADQLRGQILDARMKAQNFEPEVQSAYSLAQEHLNTVYPPEEPATGPTEAVQGSPEGEGTPDTTQKEGTPGPSYSISEDVTKRLQDVGLPKDQAEAAGKLLESYYNTRAARFKGKLGTAEELYKKEAPEIVRGRNGITKVGKNVTLHQDEGPGEKVPTFFSRLRQQISNLSQTKASPQDWSNLINNLKQKGVKSEEIDWTGVQDFLDLLKDSPDFSKSITKQDLLDFLDDTSVKLTEVQHIDSAYNDKVRHGEVPDETGRVKYRGYNVGGGEDYRELLMQKVNDSSVTPEETAEYRRLVNIASSEDFDLTEPEQRRLDYLREKIDNENASAFTSGHWSEKNVLAHIRFDTRFDKEGNKILHVAEIQSDWHQQGRKKGYFSKKAFDEATKELEDHIKKETEIVKLRDELREQERNLQTKKWSKEVKYQSPEYDEIEKSQKEIRKRINDLGTEIIENIDKRYQLRSKVNELENSKIPEAPFKTSWHELAFKRILRYAAENDYKKVVWDTGKVNADRYNLRKIIDEFHYSKQGNSYYITGLKDGGEKFYKIVDENELEDFLGKELSEKIKNQEGKASEPLTPVEEKELSNILEKQSNLSENRLSEEQSAELNRLHDMIVNGDEIGLRDRQTYDQLNERYENSFLNPEEQGRLDELSVRKLSAEHGNRVLSGVDFETGGEGMKGFYDDILPKFVNKYVKKWGTKVEPGFITGKGKGNVSSDWVYSDEDIKSPVHSIDVTDQMKQSVLSEGQPLFQDKRGSITLIPGGKNIIQLFENSDASTFFHETGHDWLEKLIQDGAHPDAPDELKKDVETVRSYLNNKGGKITRPQHEKFARSFERYLREGIAPSKELAGIFNQFKRWLTQIYKTVRQLNAPLSKEMRAVFDRLISTPDREPIIAPDREPSAPRDNMSVIEDNNTHAAPVETEQPRKDEPITSDPNQTVLNQGTKFIDKAGNIRLDNLSSDEDILDTIHDLSLNGYTAENETHGKLVAQDGIDLGDAAGVNPKDVNLDYLEKVFQTKGISLSSGVRGLRKMFVQSAENIMKIVNEGNELEYVNAVQRHMKLYNLLSEATREAGLTLRAFRDLSEEAEKAQQLNEFFQSQIGKDLQSVRNEMDKAKKLKTPSKLSSFVKDMSKPSLGEMLLEVYVNKLISGPITHMVYMAGNEVMALYTAGPERLLAAGISKLHDVISPAKPEERIYPEEALAGAYGFLYGHKNGFKAAYESLKTGQTALLPGETLYNTPFTQTRAIPGILGHIARAPGERMVAPIHSVNRVASYVSIRDSLITRQALSEGLEGQALHQRIAELQNDTPDNIVKQASKEATEQSLMGKPGKWTSNFIHFLNSEVNLPVLGRTQPFRFMSPFVAISSNINRIALVDRGPLGLMSKRIQADLAGDNGRIAQDMRIAKMSLGTAVLGTAGGLYLSGNLNPAADKNLIHAAVNQMVDGMPHSVRIGDMSYDLSRMGVLGAQLALGADMMEAAKEFHDADDAEAYKTAAYHALYSTMERMTDEGMFSGFADLLPAVDGDNQTKTDNYIKNFLSNFTVGVGSSQIAKLTDPYQRTAYTLWDSIKAKTPSLSETLQPKIDLFGEPVPNKDFYGVYVQKLSDDPVWHALKDNGYFPAPVRKDIKGVKLTPELYTEYAQKAGSMAKIQMNWLVQQPFWSQLSPQVRHDLIKSTFEKSRSAAASSMQANKDYQDLVRKADQNKQLIVNGVN